MKTITILSLQCSVLSVRRSKSALPLLLCFISLFGRAAYSDFFWVADPVANNWNNPANWSPPSVPGFFDAVHFSTSSVTDIDISQGGGVGDIFFDPSAEAFTISALPGVTFENFGGVANNSGLEQTGTISP